MAVPRLSSIRDCASSQLQLAGKSAAAKQATSAFAILTALAAFDV